MADTLAILQDLQSHLAGKLNDVEVRLFPDEPHHYRFMHPKGAVLIGYAGSDFEMADDTNAIVQTRKMTFSLTVFGRGVHHDAGAITLLDRLRLAITGYKPIHSNKIHLVNERYLSQDGGAWQYELKVRTETQQVEVCEPDNRPLLTEVLYRKST